MEEIMLIEEKHPDKKAEQLFERLIGIEKQKSDLVNCLGVMFNKEIIIKWQKDHHSKGLKFLSDILSEMPLIILSGEVGCGKSALAHSVGTPVAKGLGKRLTTFETPSDVRGSGRVGELSARITSVFAQVKAKIIGEEYGILIIDEADDLATSRSQNQAHHEDRAGLNVLVKQIDAINRDKKNLVVILITNRVSVLDAAIIRRASLHLIFKRPDVKERRGVFQYLFDGIDLKKTDLAKLVEASATNTVPFSYSDLIDKIGKQAVLKAIQFNKPFCPAIYLEILKETEPSPSVD